MFAIFFAILVLTVILSIFVEIAMRVRLTRLEVPAEKLLWWRRGGDDVAATYRELFPHSRLPHLRSFVFYLVVASAFVVLGAILWKSR